MKKVLLLIPVIAVILLWLFKDPIINTYNFYSFFDKNPEVLTKGTVVWETMSFTSTDKIFTSNPPLVMNDLVIPINFQAEYETGENYTFAGNENQSITAAKAKAYDFFTEYQGEFDSEDEKNICDLLERTSNTEACSNPKKFYSALLRLNRGDVNFFSSSSDKEMFIKLMVIKATSLPAVKISEFATNEIDGFLYYLGGNGEYLIETFISDNDLMHINLRGMEEDDVAFILSNIYR